VVLLEAGPRILTAFPEDLARRAEQDLRNLGVDVRVNARVLEVNAEGVKIGDSFLPSKTVVWAAGVVASPAAKWLGAEADRQGRVLVGSDLTVPGLPDVYVIGDTAHAKGPDGKPLPGVAPVAMQQGAYVGSVIRLRAQGQTVLPPFRYRDKGNLATIGRSSAICELGKIHLSGFVAWLTWLFVHIFYLIGFRNRVLVMIQWAWLYLTFQRGARIITSK
jgi:NADH dehydrogenase